MSRTAAHPPIGPVDATEVPRFAGPATFARLPRIDEVSRRRRRRRRRPVRLRGLLPARRPVRPGPRARSPRGCCGPTTRPLDVRAVRRASRSSTPATSAANPFDHRRRRSDDRGARPARCANAAGGSSVGGDHTIALPLLRAVAAQHGPVAVVHFDAHLDTWDTYFGAPYTHGTPFRRASEEGLIDRRALPARRHPRAAVLRQGPRRRPRPRLPGRRQRRADDLGARGRRRADPGARWRTGRSTCRSTSTCSTPRTRRAPAPRRPAG